MVLRLPLPSDKRHSNPPFTAAGLVHVLVFDCTPPPQVSVQLSNDAGHVAQLPSTEILNYPFKYYATLVSMGDRFIKASLNSFDR